MTLIQVAIPLFPRFTALDAVGPYEVLQRIPSIDVVFVGHQRGEVRTENGMLGVTCDATFDEVAAPDVVVFPGGIGTRHSSTTRPSAAWLQAVHPRHHASPPRCAPERCCWPRAGLLDGLTAATHWRAAGELNGLGAALRARPGRRAPPTAHHHRRRGVQRHRHGPAPGRAAGRPQGGASRSAAHRVRPAAARSTPARWPKPTRQPRPGRRSILPSRK